MQHCLSAINHYKGSKLTKEKDRINLRNAWWNLGVISAEQQDFQNALKYLQQASKHVETSDQDAHLLYLDLGWFQLELEKGEHAIKTFEIVLRDYKWHLSAKYLAYAHIGIAYNALAQATGKLQHHQKSVDFLMKDPLVAYHIATNPS